jgi:hypothetical protein
MAVHRRAKRIFVLSPASLSGRRANILLGAKSQCDLAVRLRESGAPLGEVFSFISGLYFRGKLAYATAFAEPLDASTFVITTALGLVCPKAFTSLAELHQMAEVPIHVSSSTYRLAIERDASRLAIELDEHDEVVLLGSVATPKYLEPLCNIFDHRLKVPAPFIGLGDMSRGALMLRAVRAQSQLEYVSAKSLQERLLAKRPGKKVCAISAAPQLESV